MITTQNDANTHNTTLKDDKNPQTMMVIHNKMKKMTDILDK